MEGISDNLCYKSQGLKVYRLRCVYPNPPPENNNYTDWFAGDENMAGDYFGYDGPCPPWNDEIIHHYHFILYALNSHLVLPKRFDAQMLLKEMEGKIIEKTEWVGTYTLNSNLK